MFDQYHRHDNKYTTCSFCLVCPAVIKIQYNYTTDQKPLLNKVTKGLDWYDVISLRRKVAMKQPDIGGI